VPGEQTSRRRIGMTLTRSLPEDPLDLPDRSTEAPNTNDPVGSTGPNVPTAGDTSAQEVASGGYGATHVMHMANELVPSAWAGWPVEWAVPNTWAGWGGWSGDTDIAFAAMDLNARIVSDMPWYVTDQRGVPQPPMPWLRNPQPEVYTDWGEFVNQCWMSLQAVGEVFIAATSRYADSNGSYPRTFMMLNPMHVTVDMVDGVRRYSVAGEDIDRRDILHIRYQSWPDQPRGIGPLEVARLKATAIKVLDRYGTDLAQNSGIPWGVLGYKGRLTGDQVAEIQAKWVAAARRRMGAPAVTDQDATLTVMQVTPKDMALVEQLQRIEARIAVLLGVPPYLLSLVQPGSSTMTYANAAQWFVHHTRTALKPIGRKLARPLNQWLLPAGTDLRIDPDGYDREDMLSRAQYWPAMHGVGAVTREEIRAAEGFYPIDAPPDPVVSAQPAAVPQHVGAPS
jgi:HK97 family phage portal protein